MLQCVKHLKKKKRTQCYVRKATHTRNTQDFIYMKFLGESHEPLRTQDLLRDTYAKKWKPEHNYEGTVDKDKLKTILQITGSCS